MKIKLDENLPAALADLLRELGHDVDTAATEGLLGFDDNAVWEAAQSARRFLITQDLDFSDIRRHEPGTHEGLMLIRLRAPGAIALSTRVVEVFGAEESAHWERCFIVVTDRKVRIRRPAASTG